MLALGRLFPSCVRAGLVGIESDRTSPHPLERALVARAVPSRQHAFFAGRAAAHAALNALAASRDAGPILAGPHREPCWPPGVVGSISHAGQWAVAAAADAVVEWGLGLDVELLNPPLGPSVQRLVASPAELAALSEGGDRPALASYASKIIFSVKEAVYKCVFPATGWVLDYRDVTVCLDLARGSFRACLPGRATSGGKTLPPLSGGFEVVDGYLLSALCVGQPGSLDGRGVVPGDLRSVPRKITVGSR